MNIDPANQNSDEEFADLLDGNVQPPDWTNPTPKDNYHLVVIGAGTAGLVAAAGAAGLGARVALVERERMGGDCLNTGCVPSKGVIRAARVASTVRESSEFGIVGAEGIRVDFSTAMNRMRKKRAEISVNDSAKRFTELGVDVFFGEASFANGNSVSVKRKNGTEENLVFKKAVIASGARAAAPPIPGIDSVHYLTNENLFSLQELPERLGVIGTGPVGCEMAQAFARFGSQVTLFGRGGRLLPRDDPQAAEIVERTFQHDGINLLLKSRNMTLESDNQGTIRISTQQDGADSVVTVDRLLVAVGRAPNVETLNLDSVNVAYDESGIKVNRFLQTTNPKIFAAGDVCSEFKFTHAADFQARAVIKNALFALGPFGRANVERLLMPWATYTSPEVAHVGMGEQKAAEAGFEIDTYIQQLVDNDRAILDGEDGGFVKVHTRKGTDRILGATIVAENAGDLISEITLAINNKIGLAKIGSTIHPYPTQADAIRRLGDQYNRSRLTSFNKKILGLLRRWNVGR